MSSMSRGWRWDRRRGELGLEQIEVGFAGEGSHGVRTILVDMEGAWHVGYLIGFSHSVKIELRANT